MKLTLRYHPAHLVSAFLALTGITLLAYVSWVYYESWVFNQPQQPLIASQPEFPTGWVGRLEIPRLQIAANILEGTDPSTLQLAVGHISGTPLPGEPGNTSLSAHRDTIFRPLRNIKAKDEITIETPAGKFAYSVRSTTIVEPTDLSVLKPGPVDSLTLVTCYPFYFIGPAPKRFIVRASRIL